MCPFVIPFNTNKCLALTKTKPKVVVRKEWLPKKGFAKSLSCASTTIVRKWRVEVSQDGNRCSIQSHSWSVALYSTCCHLGWSSWQSAKTLKRRGSSSTEPGQMGNNQTRMIGKFGKLISSQKRSWVNFWNVYSVRVSFSPWESFPEQVLCSRNKILYLLVTL